MKHTKAHISVPESRSFNLKKSVLSPETYKIHSHNNFELNYIVNGWGTRFTGDNIDSFAAGDLVLMGPGLPHCWEVKGVAENIIPECITIHFHENYMDKMLLQAPELTMMYDLLKESYLGIQFFGNEVRAIHDILQKMFLSNDFRRIIYLLEIFEILVRTNDRKQLAQNGYSDNSSQIDKEKLKKVYEFLLIHFSRKITLEEISDLCFMSPASFCRFFHRNTGKTLFTYLKEVRIGYACKLLKETELMISEIGIHSGFNNLAHFNNQFKEICNSSPAQYRKKIRSVSKVR